MNRVDLSKFDNSWYKPGGLLKRLLWYHANLLFFKSSLLWPGSLKVFLLRLFGARVGRNVLIKPCVNIKYPWFLEIGNNVWLGEECWIDNLGKVSIGDNVSISQGAMLLTGNHNYKKTTFDLMIGEITLEEGVWVGAKAVVCPGVTMRSHSVLTAASILLKDAEHYGIYQGNPALEIRKRVIE